MFEPPPVEGKERKQHRAPSGIYKSGRGYWVRLMSAIAYGVVVALGLKWLWDWLNTVSFGDVETTYVQVAVMLPPSSSSHRVLDHRRRSGRSSS